EHVLLNLADDGPEDVGHRQPQEYADVSGHPYGERVLESIKDRKAKHEWPEDRQHNQVKCSEGVDAKRGRFIQDVQYFRHPLFDGITKVVGRLSHSKLDIITDTIEDSFVCSIWMRVAIPFVAVSLTS